MMIPQNMNLQRMIDLFPNYATTDSLFTKMASTGAPWNADVGNQMDIAYFTMYSGLKYPSGFVCLHYSDGLVNSNLIAQILYTMFGKSWERLWDAYTTEYNPIQNYNIDEQIDRDRDDGRTIQRTVDDTGHSKTTDTQTTDSTVTVDNGVYGYNSTESVPSSTSTEKTDDTVTDDTVTDSTDTSTENTSDDLKTKENITRNRAGNIGQNSYQDLLTQEFELWKWNFYRRVFDDCDSYLCLLVFGSPGCDFSQLK